MRTVRVCSAAPIADEDRPRARIEISGALPPGNLEKRAEHFQHEAETIADVLVESLPGGTFDRLVAVLLQFKASRLIVSYQGKL